MGVLLNKSDVARIARVVRQVESERPMRGGTPLPPVSLGEVAPVIPVLVKWSGGSDGTSSTYASWTYNLYALADTGYATALTSSAVQPENSPARIVYGPVTKASDGSVGLAYIAADGTYHLYTCCEKHTPAGCS